MSTKSSMMLSWLFRYGPPTYQHLQHNRGRHHHRLQNLQCCSSNHRHRHPITIIITIVIGSRIGVRMIIIANSSSTPAALLRELTLNTCHTTIVLLHPTAVGEAQQLDAATSALAHLAAASKVARPQTFVDQA